MKVVIFAGGSGTRLWPVSRRRTPKQAQPFGDNQTLLQKTYERLRRGFTSRDIWLSTGAGQARSLIAQLPALPRNQVILEPARRDTAAAIGLAASVLSHADPTTIMATAWSDAYIKDPLRYHAVLKVAEKVVKRYPQRTVMIGLKPRYADTGLGYIKMKRKITSVGKTDVFLVDRFVEKPNQAAADRYVAGWQYLWNPGIFVFRVDAMLEKFRRWVPSTARLLTAIRSSIGTRRERSTLRQLFPKVKKISIDYAIMEKDRDMLVVPADFFWTDVGTWSSVHEMIAEHPHENVVRGRHVTYDASGNLLYSYTGKLIAAAGVHDMVIIETRDAILVCPRNRAQDVKHLVTAIEDAGLKEYL